MRIKRTSSGMKFQVASLGELNPKEKEELKKYLIDLLEKF